MGMAEENTHKRKRPKVESEVITLDDWGDDFDEKLEEVCAIVETSQMPPNSTKPSSSFCAPTIRNGSHWRVSGISGISRNVENDLFEDEKILRLREALKTKEGEVAILRAKLKEDALKQTRRDSELLEKQRTEVHELKQKVQAFQGELEFKNLEVKHLTATVKELELRSPKVRLIERVIVPAINEEDLFDDPQPSNRPIPVQPEKATLPDRNGEKITSNRLGDKFAAIIVPEFFKQLKEKSVVLMYDTTPLLTDGLEHLRHDKFKWTGLPTLTTKLHEIYPYVTLLTQHSLQYYSACTSILDTTKEIISSLRNVLKYLSAIRVNSKKEEELVNDTTCGIPLRVQDLLRDRLFNPEERGVEARRSLAICACVMSVYRETLGYYAAIDVLEMLKDVVKLIGRVMRPIEFSGVLAAILMFLQSLFNVKDEKLPEESLILIKSIIDSIIYCRPKLDVLGQVIATFTAASHYAVFHDMCRKSPADSCALYMDSKLKQAMFFNTEACPLKLLQIQIRTLAHLCRNREALLDITEKFTTWYQLVLFNTNETPSWLLRDNDECCDLTECYSHMLVLVLVEDGQRLKCRNLVEKAVTVLREAAKRSAKKFRCDSMKLLPFTLKSSGILDKMAAVPKEYATWLIAEYDAQLSNLGSNGWSKSSSID